MKLKPKKKLEDIENFKMLKEFLASKYGQKLINRGKLAKNYLSLAGYLIFLRKHFKNSNSYIPCKLCICLIK